MAANNTVQSPGQLLTVKEVADLLKLHVRSVWRLASTGEGGFPSPLTIGKKSKRWRLSDILQYLDGQEA